VSGHPHALGDRAVAHLRELLEQPDTGDRYEIVERIGRGGMGTVFRAHDRVLDRDVALKILALDAITPALADRLAGEARLLASLEHPGIVAVHDAGRLADGRPFHVMRLVRGRSLAEALADPARPLARGDALRVFLQACDAVAFAHARGVVHRDLSPRNVMLGEYGETLVVDWGLASLRSGAERAASGTPGFMAPELTGDDDRARTDPRVDVFALGALLAALLDGTDDEPRALSSPRALRAVVTRATAADPAARYADVPSLAADVRAWLDGHRVAAHRESPGERVVRFYRRNEPLVLLLAAYGVVRLVFLLWRRI
jgi:serine/threonine-protein kinase